jgi:hypothetical protein
VPMWRTDSGQVFRRGDRLTLGLWVLTIAVRLALAVAENLVDHAPFNANALWLGAGVTLGAQQLVMLWRAPRIPPGDAAARPLTAVVRQAEER